MKTPFVVQLFNHFVVYLSGIIAMLGCGMSGVCQAQLPDMEKVLPAKTIIFARVKNLGELIAVAQENYKKSGEQLIDPGWLFGCEFLLSARISGRFDFANADQNLPELSDCWKKIFPGKAFFALVDDGVKAVPCFGFECGEFSWHDELAAMCDQKAGRATVNSDGDVSPVVSQIPGRKFWWFVHDGCLFGAMSKELVDLLRIRVANLSVNSERESLSSNRLYQRFLAICPDDRLSAGLVYFDWRGKPLQRSFWCYDALGNATSPPAPIPVRLVLEQTDYGEYPLCSGVSIIFRDDVPVINHVLIFELPTRNQRMNLLAEAESIGPDWLEQISRFEPPASTSSILVGRSFSNPASHHGFVFRTSNNKMMESAEVSVGLPAPKTRESDRKFGSNESKQLVRSNAYEGSMEMDKLIPYQVVRLSAWSNWDSTGLENFLRTGNSGEMCPVDLKWLVMQSQKSQPSGHELVGIEVRDFPPQSWILPTCCDVGCCGEMFLKMGFGKTRDDFFHNDFLRDIFLRIRFLADQTGTCKRDQIFCHFHFRESGMPKSVVTSETWIRPRLSK